MDSKQAKHRSSREHKRFAIVTKNFALKFKFFLYLFQDNTVSCVRIVNGVDRYVTESMLTAKEENTASVKPIAEARPRQKPTVTLTSIFNSCS